MLYFGVSSYLTLECCVCVVFVMAMDALYGLYFSFLTLDAACNVGHGDG